MSVILLRTRISKDLCYCRPMTSHNQTWMIAVIDVLQWLPRGQFAGSVHETPKSFNMTRLYRATCSSYETVPCRTARRTLNLVRYSVEFDVLVTVHRVKFLIIKPTRCTNFSNLFLEWKSTCFGQFLCPSSGVFHCTHSNGICHTCLLTYDICHCCVYSEKLLMIDKGTVEFHSKNKFEKLVHLVGFIIRYSEKS